MLEAGIIQNVGGSIVTKDGWANGGASDTWATGGLVGGLVGILGGPMGMLLGASLGMLVGSSMDAGDAVDQASVIENTAHNLKDGYLALIVIADEADAQELDAFFAHYGPATVTRRSVAEVQTEIYQAEEAAAELRKQARAKMREEKKAEWKHKAQDVQDTVKKDFSELKDKISS